MRLNLVLVVATASALGSGSSCLAFTLLSPFAKSRLTRRHDVITSYDDGSIMSSSTIITSTQLFSHPKQRSDEKTSWWWKKNAAVLRVASVLTFVAAAAILTTPVEVVVVPLSSSSHHHRNMHMQAQQPHMPIQIQKSRALALTEQQLLVTDVWKEVTRQYLDPTFNGLGEDKWKAKRLEAVKAVTTMGPDDQEQVYEAIRNMLSALGDPYTRFLTPEQYEALTAYARGDSVAGVGVQLQVDPRSGQVMVLNTVPGGPAEKSGILPGDTIVEVDGMDMTTAPAEVVAAKTRGAVGTSVIVAVRHADSPKKESYISLERAKIQVNPVKTGTTTIKGKKYAILQLPSFSQETSKQVVEGLRQLQKQNSVLDGGVVIDVRGNAGGYMPAGIDVAKLFLPPQARIITEVDKMGRKTVDIADGIGSETKLPLYVVVDQRTASASEIMTAGLQDNGRATVVGASSKTFGKGRIQNVQEVGGNGSGVAVTKAKYMTPKGNDIHGVGISPDLKSDTCGSDNTVSDCLSSVL